VDLPFFWIIESSQSNQFGEFGHAL
jgi:hypothetical protein